MNYLIIYNETFSMIIEIFDIFYCNTSINCASFLVLQHPRPIHNILYYKVVKNDNGMCY